MATREFIGRQRMRTALVAVMQLACLPAPSIAMEFSTGSNQEGCTSCLRQVCWGCCTPIYLVLKVIWALLAAAWAVFITTMGFALALAIGCCLGSPEETLEMLMFLGFELDELPLGPGVLARVLAVTHALEAVPMFALQLTMIVYSLTSEDVRHQTTTLFMWFSLVSSAWLNLCAVAFALRYGKSFGARVREGLMAI
jgi:energy-coupling factor transporter transmembrane protein EcfT